MKRYWLQVYRDTSGQSRVSAGSLDYHPELLERLAALGILDIEDGMVDALQLNRLDRLFRLRSLLGVNLAGAAIILDLLDRIEELKDELRRLEK